MEEVVAGEAGAAAAARRQSCGRGLRPHLHHYNGFVRSPWLASQTTLSSVGHGVKCREIKVNSAKWRLIPPEKFNQSS